jgi:hypothetical protein
MRRSSRRNPIAGGKCLSLLRDVGCFGPKEKREEEAEGYVVGEIEVVGAQEGGEAGEKKLKQNDRQRMAKRPIFKEWIDEFIRMLREEIW